MLTSVLPSEITALCRKYGGAIPRYTSYPTAVELSPCRSQGPALDALKQCRNTALNLYVHLPYCPNLCYFCACNKIRSTSPEDNPHYLKLLRKECELISLLSGARLKIAALHLGGGSPSFLSVNELEELDQILNSFFEVSPHASKSIEVDPRTFTPHKAACAAALGFNRASVGVQDFDWRIQRIINRNQSAALSKECVTYLRKAGMQSINLDLIYGLPEQTLDGFRKTALRAVELRPERISLFGYAHVSWKAGAQTMLEKYRLPNPAERIQLFLAALTVFCNAGYKYIGLDHFALPHDELYQADEQGMLKRTFMGYVAGDFSGTLALGSSAISDLGGCLYQNHTDLENYRTSLMQDDLPIAKILLRSAEDRVRAYIIERLMCSEAVNLRSVMEHAEDHIQASEIFLGGLAALEPMAADKLVELGPDTINVTPLGRLFVRNIASVYDTYLPKHRTGPAKTFSQAL